jgi:hypothetical protein
MKPSPELRFFREQVYIGCGDWEWQVKLQQKWEPELTDAYDAKAEWRDVPTVTEKT